jgi:hypothetical protein
LSLAGVSFLRNSSCCDGGGFALVGHGLLLTRRSSFFLGTPLRTELENHAERETMVSQQERTKVGAICDAQKTDPQAGPAKIADSLRAVGVVVSPEFVSNVIEMDVRLF